MQSTKLPENMSRDELLVLVNELQNEIVVLKEKNDAHVAVYSKTFDIAMTAKVPLRAKKGKTPSMVSYRELEQWTFYAERLQEVMPHGLSMTKSQIYRASSRIGLFMLCLQLEKVYEDGDEHIGYKSPISLQRVRDIKRHMYEISQELWELEKELSHQNFEIKREMARKLKEPIMIMNKLNELEGRHMEIFKPSYETNIDNIKVIDVAFKIEEDEK